MKTSPIHPRTAPWATVLLVFVLIFPLFLSLTSFLSPPPMSPATTFTDTHTLFQKMQGALSGFFSGTPHGSLEAIEAANRSIEITGWYRAADGEHPRLEAIIQPNSDHSLNAFEDRWVEQAPYQYSQDGEEISLTFHANQYGEITTAVLNGSQVYQRLNWMETPSVKISLLAAGLAAAAAAALHRMRQRPPDPANPTE